MKIFTSFLFLALVSSPVFCAEFDADTATMLDVTANAGDLTSALLSAALDLDDDTAYGGTEVTGLVADDYEAIIDPIKNAVDVILAELDVADVAAQITALDLLLSDVHDCITFDGDTPCTCGGAAVLDSDTSADCDGNDAELDADTWDFATFEQWLAPAKIVADSDDNVNLPWFSAADLAALKLGSFKDTTCGTATLGDEWTTDCKDTYDMLRALWDATTVTADELNNGGLDATLVGAALLEYESAADATDFDALAVLFGADGDLFADNGDILEELSALFCDATTGAVNDAAAFETAYGAQTDVTLTQEDFALFADAAWLVEDYTYADADYADWLWVDAICPSGVNADTVATWVDLFQDLAGVSADSVFTFDFAVGCNKELTANVDENDAAYTGGAADKVCPPCLADGEEATFEGDLANGITRTAYDSTATQDDVVHFCLAAASDAGDSTDTAGETTVAATLEEACPDDEAEDYDECVEAFEALSDLVDSGRGFVLGFSLLAALALLWK